MENQKEVDNRREDLQVDNRREDLPMDNRREDPAMENRREDPAMENRRKNHNKRTKITGLMSNKNPRKIRRERLIRHI